ncbi:cytochrome p450 83b1 [Phtheirospermum japonicum]|uniref:Cytochrome p450 83b1 n=1 Tax=Phtheirospermum japonicum TaxID=374723 RepID=A0A830BCY4_9LAMI|nr:cytochrome p450 83b1 [Phtheirospermum japonicum]
MILHLFLLSLPIIFLFHLLHKHKKPIKPLVPPGPPGLPLIGNLLQLATAKSPHVYLWQLSQKYGPIIHMKLGSVPTVIVSSARLAEEVLKTQDLAFCSRPSFLGPKKISYNCLDMAFSPYGEYWRELRKITATHLLSLRKTQSFRPIREDEVSRMVAKIASQQIVDLSEMAMDLGITLICRIAFGKRYDDHGSERRRFDKLLHEAQALVTANFVSDYLPAFGWVDKLSGLVGRLESAFGKLDSFYRELIDERLVAKETGIIMKEDADILDILIQLKEHKTCSIDLNWDIVKAILTDIFIAASDTSAASIVWTMTALIKAPHAMHKVQAEIRNLIGKKGIVDEDDLPKLPFLKAVINETLRLYPPAPLLLPRQTTEKCTIDGYEIQPKTVVFVNGWAVARDPGYWENNPLDFLPERFMNTNIDVKGQDFGVVPFGSGRRICPGMFMGLANVEITIANLLYSFDWELPRGIKAQDIDLDVLPGLTMHKKNALVLVPKKYVF